MLSAENFPQHAKHYNSRQVMVYLGAYKKHVWLKKQW